MTYFTQEHFDLLNTYQGQKNNKANPEHVTAYEELARAYKIVEEWAQKLKQERFTDGKINIIKKPTNQANKFDGYLWGKVYPSESSPKELAYTVGINTNGIDVKIDSVGLGDKDKKRLVLLALRDGDAKTKIISSLSISDCLNMNMEQLVSWSNKQIELFTLSYDEVVNKIGLNKPEVAANTNDDIHFEQSANLEQAYYNTPLNQILYGPPGTGKTYHTIEVAVKAAEPVQYAELDIDDVIGATSIQRNKLTHLYKKLTDTGRIRFVTFHQSYGYEDFVEGLRANSEDGVIRYDVEPGVFRRTCDVANKNLIKSTHVNRKPDFAVCWESFLEHFDEDGVKVQMKKSWFKVTEITDKTIRFEKAQGVSEHSLAIKTLKEIFGGNKVIKGGLNVYYQPLVDHLKQIGQTDNLQSEPLKNFVLIIDEINRGNISKIFGELITLIEPSKRSDLTNTESLEVVLPNSGDTFSVPSNLYLIGTMNTADRSLAMMDTALRRRFDFVEMMPKPELFDGIVVKGISITKLLMTMNNRIEALYDREHTLGHAFFVPVLAAMQSGDEDKAFKALTQVFISKVVPLLEEYFFDDWNKIRLVLGDNQKPQNLQFVCQSEVSYQDLFGDNHGLDSYEHATNTYSLVSHLEEGSVWDNPAAYVAIYEPTVV